MSVHAMCPCYAVPQPREAMDEHTSRMNADTAQAYDAHMNLVLSQVEESIHIVDISEDGLASPPRVSVGVSLEEQGAKTLLEMYDDRY
jgi:hypothetical protein